MQGSLMMNLTNPADQKPDLDTVFGQSKEQVAEKPESGKRYDRHLLEWVNGSP